VSELASNAVLHARTEFELVVSVTDRRIRVDVRDRNATMPMLKSYERESVTGRGLHMVAASADQWGFEATSAGKIVWFELRRSAVPAAK
jgi:anti-sigma regulatory factor (Ser/Thr protein kinase)